MSRSIKKTPKVGCASTEKRWKRSVNRRLRRAQNVAIHKGCYSFPFKTKEIVSERRGPKDGKGPLFGLRSWNGTHQTNGRNYRKTVRRNIIERKSNYKLYYQYHESEYDTSVKWFLDDVRPREVRACSK